MCVCVSIKFANVDRERERFNIPSYLVILRNIFYFTGNQRSLSLFLSFFSAYPSFNPSVQNHSYIFHHFCSFKLINTVPEASVVDYSSRSLTGRACNVSLFCRFSFNNKSFRLALNRATSNVLHPPRFNYFVRFLSLACIIVSFSPSPIVSINFQHCFDLFFGSSCGSICEDKLSTNIHS